MDAHVFRIVCMALRPVLMHARIQKIYASSEKENGVYTFVLFAQGQKQYLIFRSGRNPFLFLSPHRPTAGSQPGGQVMRLRKYCSEQRIMGVHIDWTARTLCLSLNSEQPVSLCLNLREGAQLLLDDAATITLPVPAWPEPAQALHTLEEADAWRDWPVLSPALRKTLPLLESEEQAALLMDLQMSAEIVVDADARAETIDAAEEALLVGDLFVYSAPGKTSLLSAWPLPDALRGGRDEQLRDDILACVQEIGETLVFPDLMRLARNQAAVPLQAEKKRLEALRKKLLGEEKRLQDMADQRKGALLLQAQLYRFPADFRAAHLDLEIGEGHSLDLDMRFTVRENMARMFHQSSRGERGLSMLAGRREEVEQNWKRVCSTLDAVHAGMPAPLMEKKKRDQRAPEKNGAKQKGKQSADGLQGIQVLRSSDGFVLLRGRDARGNARILKLAAGHDIWCHTLDGPSAHVLIRRGHAGQEIPVRTLEEAGILAALKSGQKDAAKVAIQYAEARHVRPQKGGNKGAVLIAKVQTMLVACDAAQEHSFENALMDTQ